MTNLAGELLERHHMKKQRRNLVVIFEEFDMDWYWDEQELNFLAVMYRDGCNIKEMCEVFQRKDPDEVFLALFHLAKIGRIEKLEIGRLKGNA